jgi:hypothetical protein
MRGQDCGSRGLIPLPGHRDRAQRSAALGGALLFIGLLASPTPAEAQAWLPSQGETTFSFIVNDVLNKKHYGAKVDDAIDVGHTRSTTYALYASYGLTDRVMISGSLPYVETEYLTLSKPSHGGAPGLRADDGEVHGSLTDLRVGLHYQLLEQPFALAPFAAYVVPVRDDYYVQGHAAQGRGLEELILGFDLGKSLDPWIPRTYVQGRYSYGFVEKVADIAHDRENINLEIGAFVTPRWSLSVYGQWQWTHGGIDVPVAQADPLFPYHDRLAEDEFFNLGFGTSWSFTPSITGFAIYTEGQTGRNAHKIAQGVTVGVSYGFRPRAEAAGVDVR